MPIAMPVCTSFTTAVASPPLQGKVPDELADLVRRLVKAEVARCCEATKEVAREIDFAVEVRSLRQDLAKQQHMLRTQQEALQRLQHWSGSVGAEAADKAVGRARTICSALIATLAERTKQMVEDEREAWTRELEKVRDALAKALQEGIGAAVQEERSARLEELKETHAAVLSFVSEERQARIEDIAEILGKIHAGSIGAKSQTTHPPEALNWEQSTSSEATPTVPLQYRVERLDSPRTESPRSVIASDEGRSATLGSAVIPRTSPMLTHSQTVLPAYEEVQSQAPEP